LFKINLNIFFFLMTNAAVHGKIIFTLCLLNVVIEKNTYIAVKLRLFNVLIFRNYFVFNVIVFI
jgi:hypothetical protein